MKEKIKVKDKHIYSLVATPPNSIDMFTFTFWKVMMIPKSTIQAYIYILLILIYVPLISRNWKREKRKDLSVLAHENYICNTLN